MREEKKDQTNPLTDTEKMAKAVTDAETKAKQQIANAITNAQKKEPLALPAAIANDTEKFLTTRVRFCRGGKESIDVRFTRVRTEEDCQKQYGCSLIEMLDRAIKQLMTLPNYRLIGWDFNGNLYSDAAERLQNFVNAYQPAKPSEAGANARAAKETSDRLNAIATKKGMSLEDLLAAVNNLPGKS